MTSLPCQYQKKKSNKLLSSTGRTAAYFIVPALLLILWQAASMQFRQSWILPSPVSVLKVLIHPLRNILESGSLISNTAVSLLRVFIGFSVAALFGVSFGILIGTSKWLRILFAPVIELLRPLCPIAWMPFAIALFKMRTLPQLFGVDYSGTIWDEVQTGMIFVLFWGAFFPILTNTCDGIIGVRKNYISLAKTLGADKKQLLLKVYMPAALPMILTGLRLGIGLCWFVLIAAEMLPGSSSGIGYLLFYASDMAEMNVVIACMVIIAVIGAALNGMTMLLFKRFVSWHGREV